MAQSEPTLVGLRLLLTRPAGQSADWQRELQGLGAVLRHVPVLAIESIPMDAQTEAAINNMQHYDIGIFVSTNAVRHAHTCIIKQQLPIPTGLVCYTVGDKTTNAATKAGFNVLASGAVDSESLLSLPELQQLQGQRVLVFRGQGGRELITQTLSSRGAEVTHAELYRRGYPHENESELGSVLKQWRPHIVSVTSVAGVHNLIRMAHATGALKQLQTIPLLAPGDRVTAAAQANAFAKVLTARSIRFTDVSYALRDWWRVARVGVANNELKKAK